MGPTSVCLYPNECGPNLLLMSCSGGAGCARFGSSCCATPYLCVSCCYLATLASTSPLATGRLRWRPATGERLVAHWAALFSLSQCDMLAPGLFGSGPRRRPVCGGAPTWARSPWHRWPGRAPARGHGAGWLARGPAPMITIIPTQTHARRDAAQRSRARP